MATRSTISLKVSESDKGKVFHFDENKLPNNFTCENGCIDKVGDVKIEKDYLTIYHHWDGYPEGVGKTLVNNYDDYDTILNLLCGGDASSVNGEVICQYCAWRGEDWKSVKPKQLDKPTLNEEYLYKFEDGIWYFKDDYENEDWTNLEEYLNTHKED